MQILLIEDHPGAARLLRHALSESAVPVQLSVVEDGDQALAFLRREGDYDAAPRPDLILLDLHLPKTDGRVVLQVLRATPAWKTIPIMILTGVPQDEDHQQAAALGVERFLRKPRGLQEVSGHYKAFFLPMERGERRPPYGGRCLSISIKEGAPRARGQGELTPVVKRKEKTRPYGPGATS